MKTLAENGTGYLVGNRLSLADVGLIESLLMTVDYFTEELLEHYPHLKVCEQTVCKEHNILEWLCAYVLDRKCFTVQPYRIELNR